MPPITSPSGPSGRWRWLAKTGEAIVRPTVPARIKYWQRSPHLLAAGQTRLRRVGASTALRSSHFAGDHCSHTLALSRLAHHSAFRTAFSPHTPHCFDANLVQALRPRAPCLAWYGAQIRQSRGDTFGGCDKGVQVGDRGRDRAPRHDYHGDQQEGHEHGRHLARVKRFHRVFPLRFEPWWYHQYRFGTISTDVVPSVPRRTTKWEPFS